MTSFSCGLQDFDTNIHRAAANHPFFARLVSGEREVMQPRFARAHGSFRLGPDFGLDAAAAYGSRDFPVLKEEHFRTTLLRRRATCMRDGGDDHPLATVVSRIY